MNKYKRILLKLSGEALLGSHEYGIDPAIAAVIAKQIKKVTELGVQVAVVIGGGTRPRRKAWTGRRQTIWGCSPPP